jgi:5-methylcytosine-specific restriction enzyme A
VGLEGIDGTVNITGGQSVTWPFERGRTYHRRRDIHGKYGGQQQGGIITPARFPVVIAITGEEGAQHGYADRLRDDGTFEYFGEGQVGDMQLVRGNLAIETHAAAGKSLLLFGKMPDGLRYEGEWICERRVSRTAPDRNRSPREAFVFELRPLDAVNEVVEQMPSGQGHALAELRERAISSAEFDVGRTEGVRTIYERSRDVRAYVLARQTGSARVARRRRRSSERTERHTSSPITFAA